MADCNSQSLDGTFIQLQQESVDSLDDTSNQSYATFT